MAGQQPLKLSMIGSNPSFSTMNIKQKAREMFWTHWGNKAEYTEQNWLTPDSRAIIFEAIDQILDLAIAERNKELVEMIKSKGIFVGENRNLNKYIDEIINLINPNK